MANRIAATVAAILLLNPCIGMARAPDGTKAWTEQGGFYALLVDDIECMRDWYVDVLGFRLVHFNSAMKSRDMAKAALLERDGSIIELLQPRQAVGSDSSGQRIIKVGFAVHDLAALERALLARGVTFSHRSVSSGIDGVRTFAIEDPERNVIQFFGRAVVSPSAP